MTSGGMTADHLLTPALIQHRHQERPTVAVIERQHGPDRALWSIGRIARGTPMTVRFNPPPNWPAPPPGWTPPSGWQPDPTWPAAPDGWQFWVEDPPSPPQRDTTVATDQPTQPAASREPEQPAPSQEPAGRGVPLFGARKRAQELEDGNAWLWAAVSGAREFKEGENPWQRISVVRAWSDRGRAG